MEEVSISETESRYFGDLFVCCDAEKLGKVAILKATEMFRSANLSNDVIRQVHFFWESVMREMDLTIEYIG